MTFTLRPAGLMDAPEIARIHVDTWRSAYKDILPADFLERLSYDRSAQWWTSILSSPPPATCLQILESNGTAAGFAFGSENRSRDIPFAAELQAIYVAREHQGRGGGRLLFDAVRQSLLARGLRSVLLWVLENNPSRAFYERLGGVTVGQKPDTVGDTAVTLVAYGWPDDAAP